MRHTMRAVSAVTLVAVAAMYSFAWYGSRSYQWKHLITTLGFESSVFGTLSVGLAIATMVGMSGSVVISAAIGPAPVTALGLAVCGAGWAMLGLTPPESAVVALLLSAFGAGLLRPALYAAVSRYFGSGYEGARMATMVAAYAAVNLGAVTSLSASEQLGASVFLVSACLLVAAAVVALIPFGASFVVTSPQDQGSTETVRVAPLAVGLAVAVISGVGLAATNLGDDFALRVGLASLETPPWFWYINPAGVMASATALLVVAGVSQATGDRLPMLLVGGSGLLLMGAGTALSALMPELTWMAVGAALVGLGESAAYAGLLSRACGEVHFRIAALPAALVLAGPTLAPIPVRLLDETSFVAAPPATWLLRALGAVAITVVCGLLLMMAAFPVAWFALVASEPSATDDTPPLT
jgi:hypothetical protein